MRQSALDLVFAPFSHVFPLGEGDELPALFSELSQRAFLLQLGNILYLLDPGPQCDSVDTKGMNVHQRGSVLA